MNRVVLVPIGFAPTDLEPDRIVYLVSAAGGLAVAGLAWSMERTGDGRKRGRWPVGGRICRG